MTVTRYHPTVQAGIHQPTVFQGNGLFVRPFVWARHGWQPLYVCDTAEEAEQVRLAHEEHREAVERAARTLEDTLTKLGVVHG